MAKQQERREATRRNLLKAASEGFRSQGFSGVGVDAISQAAGATSGAFYAHLGSKDKAFEVALEAGLEEVIAAVPAFQADHGEAWVEAFARYYLGAAHRGDLACGCAITSLSPEVARLDGEVKRRYEAKMEQVVELMAAGLREGSLEQKKDKAWSLIAILVGGLTVCRALENQDLVEAVGSAIARVAIEATCSR